MTTTKELSNGTRLKHSFKKVIHMFSENEKEMGWQTTQGIKAPG